MGYQLVAYNLLEKYIKESIITEVKLKGYEVDFNEKNLKKALKSLYTTHPERAIQCQYLLVVIDCLNKSEHQDKARILNAATYYVREQIYLSYQGTITPFFLAPENSTLYNSLTTSLNLTNENYPNSEDLLDMYLALRHFMYAHVYKSSDSRKGYLDSELQLFSQDKIKGYKVEKVLKDLEKKVADLRLKQIDITKEQQLATEIILDKKSGMGLFGFFATKEVISVMPNSLPNALQVDTSILQSATF